VRLDGLRTGGGELAYRALFAVASGEEPGHIFACELGQTPLNAKRPIDRATAAALHPELVRRAEAEFGAALDDAGAPGDDADDGVAVLDEIDDPEMESAEVDAPLSAEEGAK